MSKYLELAEDRYENEMYEEAAMFCDKQIRLGENLPNAYYQKAKAMFKLSERNDDAETLQASLSLINEAITLNDKQDKFFDLSGDINLALNRLKRAEFDYSQAIELKPTALNYYSRGLFYAKTDKHELAVKDYKKAIELNPDDVDFFTELGDSLFELDQYEQAIFYIDKALSIEEIPYLYFLKGLSLANIRNYEHGIENIKKAIELETTDVDIAAYYTILSYIYTMIPPSEIEQDKANSEKLSYEKEFSLHNYEKNISYKNYNIAINYTKKAIEFFPENDDYYFFLAKNYNDIDDYANEIEVYNKLEEMDPDNDDIYFRRGKCFYWLNNFEKAISDLSKAIEMKPDNFTAYYFRGISMINLESKLIGISDICFAAKNEDYHALKYLQDNYDEDEIKNMLASTKKYEDCSEEKETSEKAKEINSEEDTDSKGVIFDEKTIDDFCKACKKQFHEKKYKEIISACNAVIKNCNVEHEKIYNLKAAAEIMLKMYDEAEKDCQKALLLNPDFKPAKINLNIIQNRNI